MSPYLDRSVIRILLVPILWIVLAPQPGGAQERTVVFNQVSVSENEASLLLEFEGGDELTVALADGTVRVDGEAVGSYTPGGALETAWRTLLGETAAQGPTEVAAVLSGWSPPANVSTASEAAADLIRARLSTVVGATGAPVEAADPVGPADQEGPDGPAAIGPSGDSVLARLLRRSDRLRELAFALDDVDGDDLEVQLGGTFEVEEGDTVDASVLLVDGTLELDGTLDGDVVLVGGRLEMGPEGRITGSVRSAGGIIVGSRSEIEGGVLEVDAEVGDRDDDDIGDAIRDAVREAASADDRRSFGSFGSRGFRDFREGLGELLQNFVTFGLLLGIGLGVLYFFPRQFEIVSRTAAHASGRSFLVGLAGTVLALPIFILGIVFLAVSIIGIPLLLAWIPLFPFVVAAATVFGLLAVARNLGRWVSGHDAASFDGLDASRPAVQLGWGLALLLAGYALSNLFEMGGSWFGAFEVVLWLAGSSLLAISFCVGMGAVILSRAGGDPSYTRPSATERPAEPTGTPGGPDVV